MELAKRKSMAWSDKTMDWEGKQIHSDSSSNPGAKKNFYQDNTGEEEVWQVSTKACRKFKVYFYVFVKSSSFIKGLKKEVVYSESLL